MLVEPVDRDENLSTYSTHPPQFLSFLLLTSHYFPHSFPLLHTPYTTLLPPLNFQFP
jgi:hypothetical protein